MCTQKLKRKKKQQNIFKNKEHFKHIVYIHWNQTLFCFIILHFFFNYFSFLIIFSSKKRKKRLFIEFIFPFLFLFNLIQFIFSFTEKWFFWGSGQNVASNLFNVKPTINDWKFQLNLISTIHTFKRTQFLFNRFYDWNLKSSINRWFEQLQ